MHKDKRRLGSGKIHHFTVGVFCDNLSRVTDFSGVSLLHSCDVRTVRTERELESGKKTPSRVEGLVRVRVRVSLRVGFGIFWESLRLLQVSVLISESRLPPDFASSKSVASTVSTKACCKALGRRRNLSVRT